MASFAIPLAISGIGALGSIFGGSKKARTSTMTPIESPEYNPLRDALMKQAMARIGSTTPLEGYEAGGIQTINRNAELQRQLLNNSLTARGLSTSPVAGVAETNLDTGRMEEISRFQNSLPLLQRELQNQDWQQGLQLFGQRRTGTETVNPGSAVGSGLTSAAGLLAYLYGSGAFGGGGSGKGGTGLPASGGLLGGANPPSAFGLG